MNVAKAITHQIATSNIVKREYVDWSEYDIKIMRQELICEALSFLSLTEKKDRYDKIKKDEIIRWILNQDIAPFSSEICFYEIHMDGKATRNFVRTYIIHGFDFEAGIFL